MFQYYMSNGLSRRHALKLNHYESLYNFTEDLHGIEYAPVVLKFHCGHSACQIYSQDIWPTEGKSLQ